MIFTYSAVLGLFVPSGGAKWVIEAPYVLQSAQTLGVPAGWMVVTYDLGEAVANLLQPFWMLPILGTSWPEGARHHGLHVSDRARRLPARADARDRLAAGVLITGLRPEPRLGRSRGPKSPRRSLAGADYAHHRLVFSIVLTIQGA